MAPSDILDKVAEKGADIPALIEQFLAGPGDIHPFVEALQREQSAKKFAYEKALRFISERCPKLVYPYFDVYVRLLDHDNNFLKWGAIRTIANLTSADTQKKFEAIFTQYYAPLQGPTMVTAANIIGCTSAIIRAKPLLADAIVREILKIEKARYQMKGKLSPECRNVAIGHAIDAFNVVFDGIGDKQSVLRFIKRQLKNTRKPVAQRAEKFLRKHCPPSNRRRQGCSSNSGRDAKK